MSVIGRRYDLGGRALLASRRGLGGRTLLASRRRRRSMRVPMRAGERDTLMTRTMRGDDVRMRERDTRST